MMTKFGSFACALPNPEKSTAQIDSVRTACVELFMWADLSVNEARVND